MMQRRNSIRLHEYDYGRAGAYFVTVCTKNRDCLLGTIVGGDAHIAPSVELTPMGLVAEKYLRSIPGIAQYIIMPNHVHMILRISSENVLQGPMWASAPTNANISSLVRSWKTLVTKELGCSIWQRSFYDHVIRDEKEYVLIAHYIEENPAKWFDDTYYSPV